MSISSPTELPKKRGISSPHKVTEVITADIEPAPSSSASSKPKALPPVSQYMLSQQEEENILRRSLKEIAEDIQKMEQFITLTEDSIRRERERDHFHEQEQKLTGKQKPQNLSKNVVSYDSQMQEPQTSEKSGNVQKIENSNSSTKPKRKFSLEKFRRKLRRHANNDELKKCDGSKSAEKNTKPPTFKINSKHNRKNLKFSPPKHKSRLHFRSSKVGCIEAEKDNNNPMNVEKTHAFVKDTTEPNPESLNSPCISPNIVDILSDDSLPSFDDLCDSFCFHFDLSNEESRPDGLDESSIYDYGDIEMQSITSKEEVVQVEVIIHGSDDTVRPSDERSNRLNIVNYEDEGVVNSANDANEEVKPQRSESSVSLPSNTT